MAILPILLLIFLDAGAEPPGYQGRRAVIRYDLGIFWDFFGKVADPQPVLFHKANFEYVLTEMYMIGWRYQYNKLRVLAGDHFLDPIPDRQKVGDLTNHNLSFYAKFYRYRKLGHIAPTGQYWMVGLTADIYRYQGITDVQSLRIIEGATPYGLDVSILAGTGKTFIVKDRLVIDVGFEFNVPLTAWRHTPLGGPIETTDAGVLSRQFHIFEINLGIGGLF
jgi:hypothetical protein